ncbi:MAG: DegV family protein [Firmicutes bacterium]|nr:DegV family protein [Bacillota bacterium]
MIQIIFSSPADILPDEAKQLNSIVLPVDIIFGTDVYKDGVDLGKDNFFEKMTEYTASTGKIPSTSQINTEEHIAAFKPLLEKGDEIFYIAMSSGMSLTYERALEAVKELNAEDRITIYDSGQMSIPYGMVVREVIKARDEGKSRAELLEIAKDYSNRAVLLAFINDLTYVKKGGRLKGAQAIVATVLKIKPVISIKDTKAVTIGKAIGFNGACKKIANMYAEYKVDTDKPIYMAHSNAPELVAKLANQIKTTVPGFEATGNYGIGAAIGTHTGPGCCGVAFFKKKG